MTQNKKESYINIIVCDQEYDSANHKFLWQEIAEQSGMLTIVVNIPADMVLSTLRKKTYRIVEARKGHREVFKNLYVQRPFYLIRQELLPLSVVSNTAFKKYTQRQFWKKIRQIVPDIEDKSINLLCYSAMWVDFLYASMPNMKLIYYLYDEVRKSEDGTVDKRRTYFDIEACKKSDYILAMSDKLLEGRMGQKDKIYIIGNGASQKVFSQSTGEPHRIPKSFGVIGNIRDWIDKDLFLSLIQKRRDILFVFAGNVETNMQSFMQQVLKEENTIYLGKFTKEKVPYIYKLLGGVLVPYLANDFIRATRPIKIVESVFAGVPVITVPMAGYQPSTFIRFAETVEEFSKAIDMLLESPVDIHSAEFLSFVKDNSWEHKAELINTFFKDLHTKL